MTNPNDPHVSPEAAVAAEPVYSDEVLSDRVESLRLTLATLAPEVTRLQGEQKTVWSWLRGGAGFLVFDILITVIGIIYGVNLHSIEHQNDALIAQLQVQQARLGTSVHETCNLYGLFESFYSDAARARFPQGPAAYDQGYTQLQRSSDNLQCGLKHVVPGT